jgi:hypothetical protein
MFVYRSMMRCLERRIWVFLRESGSGDGEVGDKDMREGEGEGEGDGSLDCAPAQPQIPTPAPINQPEVDLTNPVSSQQPKTEAEAETQVTKEAGYDLPNPSEQTEEAKEAKEASDSTLLAVIGILDEIKGQSNVAGWIGAGGLWGPSSSGGERYFLVGCGWEYRERHCCTINGSRSRRSGPRPERPELEPVRNDGRYRSRSRRQKEDVVRS